MSAKEIAKKSIVPVTSAVLGGTLVLAGLKFSPSFRSRLEANANRRQPAVQISEDLFKKERGIHHPFADLLNDEFTTENNPFEQINKMRKEMENRMEQFDPKNRSMRHSSDSRFFDGFSGGIINDISEREDDRFIYYDIKVDDVKSTSINTKVESGYLTVTGTIETKADSEGTGDHFSAQSVFKSSFNRIFPLPENVDQNKMQMLTEQDKVVLKFPKKTT